MILLGGTTLAVPGRFPIAHAEHLAIVKAIADPESTEAAAWPHIRTTRRAWLKLLRTRLVAEPTEIAAPAEA